ncbi:MAG TPA: hypothetical protein VFT26_01830, partial [Pyrinomonadaceae bacterium]|nr:hypothetical protein [Pyrinomonadaceae bacterium]
YRKKCANGWSSGPNDGYFHRHLTEHLARAGKVDEIHELLAAELDQENAWYAANDAIGNIDGYLSDVSRATRLEQSGKFDDRDAMRRQLSFQMRYVLIGASIRSLASTIPDSVRTALVRNGVWSGARGLAEANQIPDASRRVYALAELIPSLDETLCSRAIDDALRSARMCNEQEIPSLLGRMVPLLDPVVGQSIVDEALETARSIHSPGYRATALAGLVPLIDPDRKEELITQTLVAMTQEVTTAGVNQGGFDAFTSLARHVEGVTMEALIVLLRLIPNEFMRARAYALTARYVSADKREEFAREGLELVSPNDRGMVALYVALAMHLPETSPTELFDEVVRKDTRQIDFLLNMLPRDMSETEVDEWMSRLDAVTFDRGIERFEAYVQMLERLPEAR